MAYRRYGRRRRTDNLGRDMAIAGGLMGALQGLQFGIQQNAQQRRQQSLLELQRQYNREDAEYRYQLESGAFDERLGIDRGFEPDESTMRNFTPESVTAAREAGDIALLRPVESDEPPDTSLAGRFTPESIREFAESGDQSVLVPIPGQDKGDQHASIARWNLFTSLSPEQQEQMLRLEGRSDPEKKAVLDIVTDLITARTEDPLAEPVDAAFIQEAARQAKSIVSAAMEQGAPPDTGGQFSVLLQQARDAIARGADRRAVIERLRAMGVPEDQIDL